MPRNNYVEWEVSYWAHHRSINDCAGNSSIWKGKARTPQEAARKANIKEGALWFRIRYVKNLFDTLHYKVTIVPKFD